MKQIWKFQLDDYTQTIIADKNWKPLSVHVQHGSPCLWALVDTEALRIQHRVEIVGTGRNADSVAGMKFLGTFLLENGMLVFHVFVDP